MAVFCAEDCLCEKTELVLAAGDLEEFTLKGITILQKGFLRFDDADRKDKLLPSLEVGDKVNVERSMMMNGRLDGHIVQGHVDETAECVSVRDTDGSWYYTFRYKKDDEMAAKGYMTVDKGSVTVNGVSLTVCEPTDDSFSVAIIPYTYEHTNFHTIKVGTKVNIEFDIIGKYIARMIKK